MFKFSKKKKVDFLILDDLGNVDFSDFERFVFHYKECTVYSFKELTEMLNFDFDKKPAYAIGIGGKKVLEIASVKPTGLIDIKRVWESGKSVGFSYSRDVQLAGSPCLVDDVISSGETAHHLKEKFKLFKPEIVCLVYNLNPGEFKDENGVKGFDGTTCALCVEGIVGDSYWHPAVYSLRHILEKPKENPFYLKNMAKQYFNDDLDGLEKAVSKIMVMKHA